MNELKRDLEAIRGKKRTAAGAMGLGVTSLITIMAVLMLTSFALFSLLSANSDFLLSDKAAQAVKDYYEADCYAEEWWQGLRSALGEDEGKEASVTERLFSAGYVAENIDGGYVVRKSFPMGDKKNLKVVAAVTAEGFARIVSWQTSPAYDS